MESAILDNDFEISNVDKKFAGFWVRVGASFIDLIVYLPLIGLNLYNLYVLKSLPVQLIILMLTIIYKPFMEYRYGATLGKMAVKLKVVNSEFNPITLPQAIIRFMPWLIGQVISIIGAVMLFQDQDFQSASNMTEVGLIQNKLMPPMYSFISSFFFIISCIMVAFTSKKQGLHDLIARTYCIYK